MSADPESPIKSIKFEGEDRQGDAKGIFEFKILYFEIHFFTFVSALGTQWCNFSRHFQCHLKIKTAFVELLDIGNQHADDLANLQDGVDALQDIYDERLASIEGALYDIQTALFQVISSNSINLCNETSCAVKIFICVRIDCAKNQITIVNYCLQNE